ncbi:hypothetical protein B7486_66155, partial [cyanobacterium TDX16]
RALGAIGHFGAFSFHGTKNLTCGEGGALAIADARLVEHVEIMREKGTDRARFLRGEVDRYTWVDEGSSWVLAEPLAALLLAQLDAADHVQAARRAVWQRYASELAPWAAEVGALLPPIPEVAEPAWHCSWVLVPRMEDRDAFMDHLAAAGVASAFHFQPLHRSAMGRRLAAASGSAVPALPVTDSVAERLVRLPFFTDLTEDEQTRVIEAATAWRPGR